MHISSFFYVHVWCNLSWAISGRLLEAVQYISIQAPVQPHTIPLRYQPHKNIKYAGLSSRVYYTPNPGGIEIKRTFKPFQKKIYTLQAKDRFFRVFTTIGPNNAQARDHQTSKEDKEQ